MGTGEQQGLEWMGATRPRERERREEEAAVGEGRNEIDRVLEFSEGVLYAGKYWAGLIFGNAGPSFFRSGLFRCPIFKR